MQLKILRGKVIKTNIKEIPINNEEQKSQSAEALIFSLIK